MARWTIVGTGHEPGFTHLLVHASTSIADHLFMSWALHRPAQHEIWRVVRGKRVFCGYKYVWDTPSITEQTQPGDTLFHSFFISGLPAGSTVWYYLHAPNLPSPWETQGPLMGIDLLAVPSWTTRAYFASKLKGMFKTVNFSQPPGPQPTWIPDNDGLPFLDIRQATPDPWDPYHRRFIVCHGDVYRMDNIFIDEPATATQVLTQAHAVFLTGGDPGDILWIAGNFNHENHFYALFRCDVGGTGFWCLKTIDAGLNWTPHQIHAHVFSFAAGNIMAGHLQGTSPYPPGDVLYATLNFLAGGAVYVARSLDEGDTWALTPTRPPGTGIWEPRLHIDPANQAQVYVGADFGGDYLWYTPDHGQGWGPLNPGQPLGIIVSPTANQANLGTRVSNPAEIRVLKDWHIWKTSDGGVIWRDQGPSQYSTRHLFFRHLSYDYLYLARNTNTPGPDGLYAQHVLFVSTDEGSNMFGKAGAHADQANGGGDSIPHNCGGVAHEGILTLP